MKVLKQNVGLISDIEVLAVLEERGAAAPTHQKRPHAIEIKVHRFLSGVGGSGKTLIPLSREKLAAFVEKLGVYGLTKAEKLQIINHRPVREVELNLVVAELDKKLTEEMKEELMRLVAETFAEA